MQRKRILLLFCIGTNCDFPIFSEVVTNSPSSFLIRNFLAYALFTIRIPEATQTTKINMSIATTTPLSKVAGEQGEISDIKIHDKNLNFKILTSVSHSSYKISLQIQSPLILLSMDWVMEVAP